VQLLSIHELVNRLPDPHYATLRHLMLHLDRVAMQSKTNRMNVANLSIVFGPTLIHNGIQAGLSPLQFTEESRMDAVNDMHYQCKVIEVILKTCRIIFETPES
jgi:hypothetical protein